MKRRLEKIYNSRYPNFKFAPFKEKINLGEYYSRPFLIA
jgi:hypothetical protein